METTLTLVMDSINNHFVNSVEKGAFVIAGGAVSVTTRIYEGQYIWIVGSALNDGVWKVTGAIESGGTCTVTCSGLKDEAFTGAVCGLAVPDSFLEVVKDIQRFIDVEREDKNAGRVTGEKFADYSYTLGSSGQNGLPFSWDSAFSTRLHPFRQMFDERNKMGVV